jgi:hypothetical protein
VTERPRRKPKYRTANTARNTSPPEMTACTTDTGASESAPTCRRQARIATIHPTANHREESRSVALRNGCEPGSAGRVRHRGARTESWYRAPKRARGAAQDHRSVRRAVTIGENRSIASILHLSPSLADGRGGAAFRRRLIATHEARRASSPMSGVATACRSSRGRCGGPQ